MKTVLVPGVAWPHRPIPKIKWAYGTGKRALTDEQVIAVRLARDAKVGYGVLVARYKLGRKVLSDAVHGRGAYK